MGLQAVGWWLHKCWKAADCIDQTYGAHTLKDQDRAGGRQTVLKTKGHSYQNAVWETYIPCAFRSSRSKRSAVGGGGSVLTPPQEQVAKPVRLYAADRMALCIFFFLYI